MSGAPAAAEVRPFLLGIVGDSGSGKSTVAAGVRTLIGEARTATMELDDYHRFTRAERQEKGMTALNPAVHNLPLVAEHLALLRRGHAVRNRRYEHADGTFGAPRAVEPNEVVVVRGLLGFPTDELRQAYDLAVYLQPEPELLFRWKLRRDVRRRGYTEAEVLKYITGHVLDAKQYVVPQADRADVVVRYEIAEWDAPDAELTASVVLRRDAAEAGRGLGLPARFGKHVRMEAQADGCVVRVGADLPATLLDAWGRETFPETYDAAALGGYEGESGPERLPVLAFVQLLVAHLAQTLRGAAAAPGAAA